MVGVSSAQHKCVGFTAVPRSTQFYSEDANSFSVCFPAWGIKSYDWEWSLNE